VLGSLLACLLLALSVSGCVDIYGARSVFGGKVPPAPLHFKTRNKANIYHAFETKDTNSISFTASCSTTVKKHAEWLEVYVKVTLAVIPVPLPDLPFTIPERYVRVQVKTADGSQWMDSRYVGSDQDNLTALNPIDGPWSITVEAVGVGFPALSYQDSLRVMLTDREPV